MHVPITRIHSSSILCTVIVTFATLINVALVPLAPDPIYASIQLGVEFGSKLITIPEENKVVKLQCTSAYRDSDDLLDR